ncbi:uncharacterized protein LY89DRAFT_257322 [Mollisia scopiformis]|uniref:Uncharacterized protein n=1 Tax=Mollisia scopiformis TaxID=149040 RepID=A0A132BD04_MOLSC|nr:uncharacterized protein LY89DRAFT_257322 [Mollisia scopiformis]KUJ10310.1 hypothetical protein LY89DRAFT_257322 [Mollisia scopiformis]
MLPADDWTLRGAVAVAVAVASRIDVSFSFTSRTLLSCCPPVLPLSTFRSHSLTCQVPSHVVVVHSLPPAPWPCK